MEISEKQLELIEKMGVLGEKQGMQPSLARVAALLLISDKIELTFDEIRNALQLSKSATSNAINQLLDDQSISYKTIPGDRKRYFYSNVTKWKETAGSQLILLNELGDILNEIRALRTEETVEFNASIDELNNFLQYFINEINKIYERWEKKA